MKKEMNAPNKRRLRGRVEKLVALRTAKLMSGNEGLEEETKERKRAEEALRESGRRYRALIENMPISCFTYDRDGRILSWNKGAEQIYGYTKQEATGASAYDLIVTPMTKKATKHVIEKVFAGETITGSEWQDHNKKGEVGWRIGNTFPLFKTDGSVECGINLNIDITERVKAENALQESEQKYRELAALLPQIVYELDEKGNFTYANRIAFELSGYTAQDFHEGLNAFQTLIPEDRKRARDNMLRVLNGERLRGNEYTAQRKDGSTFPIVIYSSPIMRQEKPIGIRGIIVDLTEHKAAEEALRKAHEELQREYDERKILSENLIDLLERDHAQIAMELHDHVGQVLTSCKMDLETLESRLVEGSTELGRALKTVREKTTQAMNDIRTIAKGLMPATLHALGLVPSIRALISDMQRQTDLKITFHSRGVPGKFDAEKMLALYRILQQAMSNVVKHSKAKNVFVNLTKKGSALLLSVEDDGVGFKQKGELPITKKGGPLGLRIMRERTMQFGGDFSIESAVGKGTHLSAEIPI